MRFAHGIRWREEERNGASKPRVLGPVAIVLLAGAAADGPGASTSRAAVCGHQRRPVAVARARRLGELSPHLRRDRLQPAHPDRSHDRGAAAAGVVVLDARQPALAADAGGGQRPDVRARGQRPGRRLRRRVRRRGVDPRAAVPRRRGHVGSLPAPPRRVDSRRHHLLGHRRLAPRRPRRAHRADALGGEDRRLPPRRRPQPSAAHRRRQGVPAAGRRRPRRARPVPRLRRQDRAAAVVDLHRARPRGRAGLQHLDPPRGAAAGRRALVHGELRPRAAPGLLLDRPAGAVVDRAARPRRRALCEHRAGGRGRHRQDPLALPDEPRRRLGPRRLREHAGRPRRSADARARR